MAVYTRPDSPYFWLWLERPGLPALRESTRIPISGGTAPQTRVNKQLAEAAYAARMGDLARDRYQLPVARPEISFSELADWYVENISATKGGVDRERSMLKQLARYFVRFKVHQITMQDGLEWRRRRSEEVKATTVNRELTILKHLLETAVPKYLPANPLAGMPELDEDEVEVRILTFDEEERLLTVCREDPEDYALVVTALDTLQRLTSCANLQWPNVRGEQLVFLNAKVKSKLKRGNWIDASTRLREALAALPRSSSYLFEKFQRWKKDPKTGQVVPNESARRNAVIRMFMQRCDQANVQTGREDGGISFHCLRHTGATIMLRSGVDPKTVMEIGGWRRLEQLQQYVHASRDTKRKAVELVGSRSRETHANPPEAQSA